MIRELSYEECANPCPEITFDCASTEELRSLDRIIGQPRAVRALDFGLRIDREGFNVYVSGLPGTGRKTAVTDFIRDLAKDMPTPPDWCYVHDFDDSGKPQALELPPGRGNEFREAMEGFVGELIDTIREAFESDEYSEKVGETLKDIQEEINELSNRINRVAGDAGFQIQQSPIGLVLVPLVNGRPISPQELPQLSPDARKRIEGKREEIQNQIMDLLRKIRDLERKKAERINAMNREVVDFALDPILNPIRESFKDCEGVLEYLRSVEEDVMDNLPQLLQPQQQQQQFMGGGDEFSPFRRYRVNVIVDNADMEGAPVEIEENPTYYRLFGVIEKEARFGALITDFTMIRPGSAHKANGGFLVIPVERVLRDPVVWESLKQTMTSAKLAIEEPAERFGYMVTRSLRPQPIPFDAKVIVIGDPEIYGLLYSLDKDFRELFKVRADFDTSMERSDETVNDYASFICTLCKKENLLHLDPSGISAIVEYGSRLVGDKNRLSTRFSDIADIIREADYYARMEGAELVTRNHVEKQLEEKIYRSNLIQEKIREMIEKGTILIDIKGEREGQINGLAVYSAGDFAFGKPSRITASVGVGKEGIIDIERQAEMGGPIHTKGVMILSGYLSDRYAGERPLSLAARLVFEQSYSGVEGDSASSTELYSLLSALSGAPIRQNLAVTGSVNQKGEVQAIGGVNEKVEGYFDVCKAIGLTGNQGCLVPKSNVQNLMLRREVVEAVKDGKFHVYPVGTVDEGIEILTGMKAGERREDGTWEEGTINHLVQERLSRLAENARRFKEF